MSNQPVEQYHDVAFIGLSQAEASAAQGLASAGSISHGPSSMQRQMSFGLAGRRMSLSSRSAPPNLQPASPTGHGSSGNLADAQQAEHNGTLIALPALRSSALTWRQIGLWSLVQLREMTSCDHAVCLTFTCQTRKDKRSLMSNLDAAFSNRG